MASTKVVRAIRAFESAVETRALSGVISLNLTVNERTAVEHNYIRARARLERLMENV